MASDPTIVTFRDVEEYLVDSLDVPASGRNLRLARQAILTAYRRLPNFTRWKSLERRATLITTASQTSSTLTFDFTGGAYERMATIAAGTWPTDAAEGKLVIANRAYIIDRRVSSTIVTLDANSNPGADVAAGTSYTWYRSTYALPTDFRKMGHMFDVDNEKEIRFVHSDTLHEGSIRIYDTPDTPWEAAIRGTGDYVSRMSVEFSPPPDAAYYYDYVYEASPRPLLIEKYSTGTVSTSGTAVTGSGTVFPTDCEGAIIRFGTNTLEPTNVAGGYDSFGTWLDNRYVAQRRILGRNSDTALVIDEALSTELTAVKYTSF